MSSAPVPRLELLIPWELPTEQTLSAADQLRIGRALSALLQALQEPDETALARMTEALAELGPIAADPSDSSSTKTALQQPQIEDFDRYFEAVHVQTADPAGCLVRNLLLTYQRVVQLWRSGEFDPQQIADQKQGFASYGKLLLRIFQLSEMELQSESQSRPTPVDELGDGT